MHPVFTYRLVGYDDSLNRFFELNELTKSYGHALVLQSQHTNSFDDVGIQVFKHGRLYCTTWEPNDFSPLEICHSADETMSFDEAEAMWERTITDQITDDYEYSIASYEVPYGSVQFYETHNGYFVKYGYERASPPLTIRVFSKDMGMMVFRAYVDDLDVRHL